MRTRFVLAVVLIALALTPVVLSIGALVLIPLAIVVLPVVLFAAIGALPAMLLSAARGSEPHTVSGEPIATQSRIPATAA